MVLNFIAFVFCTVVAVWQKVHDNLGFCVMDAVLALLNLPFAIKWFKNLLEIDSQFNREY